jgi:hypothetical protein
MSCALEAPQWVDPSDRANVGERVHEHRHDWERKRGGYVKTEG